MAGMDTRDEHIYGLSRELLLGQVDSIAQGKFPVEHSYSLMASADWTGTLAEDEAVALVEGEPLVGHALCYKSPGLLPGDVRRIRTVAPTPAMREHLCFPCTLHPCSLHPEQRAKSREPRAQSREQKAEGRGQREEGAESREQNSAEQSSAAESELHLCSHASAAGFVHFLL